MEELAFYNTYHTHPVNKVIHFFCIPVLIFTTINFFSCFKIVGTKRSGFHNKQVINLSSLLYNFYTTFYFLKFKMSVSLTMFVYLSLIYFYAYYFRIMNNTYLNKNDKLSVWQEKNIKLFLGAWILQFLGHFIEGNRPALMDNVSQTFLYAPVFSLNHLLPFFN